MSAEQENKRASRLDAMRQAEAQAAPEFDLAEEGGPDNPPRLPQPCPVTPLGGNGKQLIFLDGLGQVTIAPTKCDKGDMIWWFGLDYLETHFENDRKGSDRWCQRKAQAAFVMDCRDKGIFDPAGKVFGRGAHRGPLGGGELVLHLGDRVFIADPKQDKLSDRVKMAKAGTVTLRGRRLFYPAASALPQPALEPAPQDAVERLYSKFKGFSFVNGKASALLLLGMVAQMYVCGALKWRSHIWLTAPTGSGKTTLQDIIRACVGEWCLHCEDTTEAGIRQMLGDDTLPVLIDEAEAHDKPERLQQILNLMKKSSSGAKIFRGGVDGKGTEFTGQSCFLMSSVLHAPLRGEDRNRMAILEMRKLPKDGGTFDPELELWDELGPAFQRRMIAHWHRWQDTLEEYKAEIGRLGYPQRARDTYGTLLACADLFLYDKGLGEFSFDSQEAISRVQDAVASCIDLMEQAEADSETDDVRVRRRLLATMLPGYGGKPPETVATWIERAMEWVEVSGEHLPDGSFHAPVKKENKEARDRLKAHGLMLIEITEKRANGTCKYKQATPEDWDRTYLAIAGDSNVGLCSLFEDSDWQRGGWKQSFARIKGVERVKPKFPDGGVWSQAVPLNLMMFRDEAE